MAVLHLLHIQATYVSSNTLVLSCRQCCTYVKSEVPFVHESNCSATTNIKVIASLPRIQELVYSACHVWVWRLLAASRIFLLLLCSSTFYIYFFLFRRGAWQWHQIAKRKQKKEKKKVHWGAGHKKRSHEDHRKFKHNCHGVLQQPQHSLYFTPHHSLYFSPQHSTSLYLTLLHSSALTLLHSSSGCLHQRMERPAHQPVRSLHRRHARRLPWHLLPLQAAAIPRRPHPAVHDLPKGRWVSLASWC